jgi:hypothetical protein
VINNGGFTLVSPTNYGAYWADPADRTDNLETLLEIDADVINNNGFDDFAGMYFDGYNDIYASSDLYALYSSTDVRRSVIVPGTTKSNLPAYVVTKFPNATNTTDRDNIKVVRLSEVYLIAAEASLPGDEPTALMYLNDLVSQRDPSVVYASTGATLLNDIVNERRKELAFEGDRFFDLNRLKATINRASNPAAIPAPLVISYPFDKRLSPIPLTEIQANPNIAGQQNPGY